VASVELGALILFAADLAHTVAFYRALGVPLAEERHEDGPAHFACELGPVHLAVFAAEPGSPAPDSPAPSGRTGRAPSFRAGGSTFPGFAVPSIETALGAARALGAPVLQEPAEYPWGTRAVIEDPDGRAIELFQRPG